MRYFVFILIATYALAAAGIIEMTDNDRFQIIRINCVGFDSVTVGVAVNQDTVYFETVHTPIDSIFPDQAWQYIPPDRDEKNRVIPGHYEGEYWYYVDSWLNGDRIASADTFHVSASYDIPGGCSAPPIIDP